MTTIQEMLALMGDYVVGAGDTYDSIAQATGTTPTDVYNANGGADLNAGMTIPVPPAGAPQMDEGAPPPIYPPGYTTPQPAGTPQMDEGVQNPSSPGPNTSSGGGTKGQTPPKPPNSPVLPNTLPGQQPPPTTQPPLAAGAAPPPKPRGTPGGGTKGEEEPPLPKNPPLTVGDSPFTEKQFEQIEFLFMESLVDIVLNYGGVPPVGPNGESLYIPDYIFRENGLGIPGMTDYDMIEMGWVLNEEGNWVFQGVPEAPPPTGGPTSPPPNYGYSWRGSGRGVSYPSYSGTQKRGLTDWRIGFE